MYWIYWIKWRHIKHGDPLIGSFFFWGDFQTNICFYTLKLQAYSETFISFFYFCSVIQGFMIEKLFPLDKNYILRQAQFVLEEELLEQMIYELKRSYTYLYNPLQLMDQTYARILDSFEFPTDRIRMIYRQLCGIYRFKHGDNQLELLFDGKSHFEKFKEDWENSFINYVKELGNHEQYVKTMLRMTVLYDTESRAEWAENNCKAFINQYFDLKIVKRQGELRMKVG